MNPSNQLDLCFTSIVDLSACLSRGDISPVEVTEATLRRIEQHNDEMHVYISVASDIALEQARQAEREILGGKLRGPLHGIPISLKDNIATKDIRTTCASMVNPEWMPDLDATVYTKLRQSGAVLAGKANLYEYAFSMNPAFPNSLNPWHAERSSSGSSSGSAVGVAIGMAYGSIGSDTGGSGRAPASANSVVGFKATYGRVSRAGVVSLSYSLDHVTVLARQVADAAIMMEAISGHDMRDEYSSELPVPDMQVKLGRDLQGMRIGRACGYTVSDLDPDVAAAIARAVEVLQSLGASIDDVRLPGVEHCAALHASVMLPEAAVVHHRSHRDSTDKMGDRAVAALDLGGVVFATDYIRAQQARKQMRNDFRRLFETYDVIVGPAWPVLPGEAGSWSKPPIGPEYTGIYNLVGTPAIVIPAGFSRDGMPIGLQIAGKWFDESTVIQVAHAFEQATEWHKRRPPLPQPQGPECKWRVVRVES